MKSKKTAQERAWDVRFKESSWLLNNKYCYKPPTVQEVPVEVKKPPGIFDWVTPTVEYVKKSAKHIAKQVKWERKKFPSEIEAEEREQRGLRNRQIATEMEIERNRLERLKNLPFLLQAQSLLRTTRYFHKRLPASVGYYALIYYYCPFFFVVVFQVCFLCLFFLYLGDS